MLSSQEVTVSQTPSHRHSIPLPDLLNLTPHRAVDEVRLGESLELAFLGSDPEGEIDRVLAAATAAPSSWQPDLFTEDLFVDQLVESCLTLPTGRNRAVHGAFLSRVLARPPVTVEAVRFRQEILAELLAEPALAERAERLHGDLAGLLNLFRAAHSGSRFDPTMLRFDVLRQVQQVVDRMADDFADAGSGLRRLAETAEEIRASGEYRTLAALLAYDGELGNLAVRLSVGADGKLRHLAVEGVEENTGNPFYRSPGQRLRDRLMLLWRGYRFGPSEVVNRLLHDVFNRLKRWLMPLLQLEGQLELYLAALAFRERCHELGLATCLPEIGAPSDESGDGGGNGNDDGDGLELEALFNPLLLSQGTPVPCTVRGAGDWSVTLLTGPNSGGKTRLLQALGLAQLLGQSGLFVPARSARLPLVPGLFASLDQAASADQLEGRLGMELLRIRRLFEAALPGSLVLLDELCSGTNPSEAGEIFSMVLELLGELVPRAYITTHFLDYSRELKTAPPIDRLGFLQVEMDDEQRATYQFIPGVADTSLAATTARRLGVTFEELSGLLERRRATVRQS